MRDRWIAVAQRPEGGYISIAVGWLWETIEAAHNWSYVCELAHRSGLWAAAKESAQPSALAMIFFGAVWVIAARLLKKSRTLVHVPQVVENDLVKALEVVASSHDDMFFKLHEDRESRDVTIMKWAQRDRDRQTWEVEENDVRQAPPRRPRSGVQ